MAQLTSDEFYDKWVPLLSDNDFQNINGSRLELFLEDLRDSFAPIALVNAQPVPPAVNFDPVTRLLTAQHPLGDGELEYTHNNTGFTAYQPIQVDDAQHAQGEWRFRVMADTGRNPSQTTDSPLIAVKATATPAGPGTIKAASISDSTEAGRALLTAKDVAAQRKLLDQLGLIADQYGAGQPKFDTLFGDAGALAYILAHLAGGAAPVAPTLGIVDDTADTFSFVLVPGFPSLADYEVFGVPGQAGTVSATAAGCDITGSRLTMRGLTGNLALGTVGGRIAASGNRPAGASCTNDKPFTGTTVVTTPTTTTPASTALNVSLAIAVASIMAGNPLTFSVTGGGGTGPYSYAVVATNSATGASYALGSATSGSWTPAAGGDYELTATITDSTGASKVSAVRSLHVSNAPVANAGADNVLTQPASSAQLAGSGYEAGGTIASYSWSQSSGSANATFTSKTVAQPTVSGLTAVGDYHFQLIVTDATGNVSLADEVVVTVVAAATTPTTTTPIAGTGNYITIDYITSDYIA